MAIFKGSLKPGDPLLRTNFLIMHPTPYSPGGKKPGTNSSEAEAEAADPEAEPKPARPSGHYRPKK
jgi:hypothetical protein